MGGIWKKMPITWATFLAATLAISGLPGLSGFFSKDEILWWAFSSSRGSWVLWLVGFLAAGMTAFYMFRLVFMTFHGKERTHANAKDHIHESPLTITIPLIILGSLAVVGGWVGIPAALGGVNHFEHFLAPVFEHTQHLHHIHAQHELHAYEFPLMGCSIGVALVGIFLAWFMYLKSPELPGKLVASFQGLYRTIFNKWYVDEIYDALFVNPTKRLGTFLWRGFDVVVVDGIVNGVGKLVNACSTALRFTQSGFVHSYAFTMVVGVLVIVGIYVLK